jgi:hypothetical protein
MLRLRPHHIIDIVRNIGNDREIVPHEYGHLVHIMTLEILGNAKQECQLIIENDDICRPCKMLDRHNRCTDILHQLDEPLSKQVYNDELDKRILDQLKIKAGEMMKIKDYLKRISADLDNIARICTHPKEDPESRKNGLIKGLQKLKVPYPFKT